MTTMIVGAGEADMYEGLPSKRVSARRHNSAHAYAIADAMIAERGG